MPLMLSESQREMHGRLRWFVEEAVIPVASSLPHAARYPAEVVNRVAELRLFGILIPQEHGGPGHDPVSSTIAVVELARGRMAPGDVGNSHPMLAHTMWRFGATAKRQPTRAVQRLTRRAAPKDWRFWAWVGQR